MRIRHPMLALTLVALGAWVTLGLFGKFVSPTGVLARIVFLLLLFLALAATLAPIAHLAAFWLVRSKWYHLHGVRHAVRQGALIALAAVANLTLIALGAWSWIDAILLVVAIVLTESIALARK
jgi:hypothetical protein